MENFSMRIRKLTMCTIPLLMVTGLAAQERTVQMQVTAADVATATAFASGIRYHLTPAPTPLGKAISLDSPGISFATPKQPTGAPIASLPSFPAGSGFYPSHVSKASATGVTIVSAKSHPIFVDCASTCWGNPALFLNDLGASSMIHLLDQYTGSTANGRYTLGTSVSVTGLSIFPGSTGVPTLGENDILGIVHAAAKLVGGTGYGHIYHVFLPRGVDTCMDEGSCYSPDNGASFGFCAYHFRVHFADIGNVYYSVEPFQGPLPAPLLSCAIPFATPNGQLTDSTDKVLSHELFETISDPDITTGYRALDNNSGPWEIGDLCTRFVFGVTLNTRLYAIQAEYSDKYEACATTP